MATERQSSDETEDFEEKLFTSVMKGNWDDVVRIYWKHQDNSQVLGVRITSSMDTALHMAVYEGDEWTVERLLRLIDPDHLSKLMESANDRGNTPLHLAAMMGNARMCLCIASMLPCLVGLRNNNFETPLFLAALHGKKEAFTTLYLCCRGGDISFNNIYSYGRSSDGRTVLHCAIDGEYFELAYYILSTLPKFCHSTDELGYTPLHLLASKHSAFKSSTRLTWLQKIIYFSEDSSRSNRTTDVENPQMIDPMAPPPPPPPAHDHYTACRFIKNLFVNAIALLISGDWFFPKHVAEMKQKHSQSIEIMKKLLENESAYDYRDTGSKPTLRPDDSLDLKSEVAPFSPLSSSHKKQIIDPARLQLKLATDGQVSSESSQNDKRKIGADTIILTAAKNGISEIVREFLKVFPLAIHDVNSEGKNIMLLAVQNRQPHVCQLLLSGKYILTDNLFHYKDNEGNNALHLAAMLKTYRSWLAPNAVLQMQWEIKWYEFIKKSAPRHLLAHQNNHGKTPEDVFMETHDELVKNDTEWLMKTSESCTIVAALIATVAFATSASVPGGINGSNGEPVLKRQRMFEVFAVSSLVALCFSLTAVIMFLAILTSRHQAADFGTDLPRKLLMGLTALFVSIASMLVSFCGGHFFVVRDVLRDARVAEYLVALLPVTIFAIAQFPLYVRLLWATIKKTPERGFILTT